MQLSIVSRYSKFKKCNFYLPVVIFWNSKLLQLQTPCFINFVLAIFSYYSILRARINLNFVTTLQKLGR